MADRFARRDVPASAERIAALHRLCNEDYAKGQQQRALARPFTPYEFTAPAISRPAPEPTDLAVAVRVAQQLLDSDNAVALRESLRLVLRALGAEPVVVEQPPQPHTPIGPGCGAPAAVRFEGYSARNGLAHGSLDLVVYACDDHAAQAKDEWLGGLMPYRTLPTGSRCGEKFDFTTLGGDQ
ncbi:hypothetical protein F3K20_24885 [Streptomyces scabiei]|uniref:hypothetical protein n=1 Tax=Streptomyces scabiei TaxID=1930 RepID=UPI001B30B30C|nr:hypothetical protein [Streptomyces sp. LBUM 1482]QTU47622.1 hypothetical protein F3K20_24885 [Streptomyces sp. LBUM 1482]